MTQGTIKKAFDGDIHEAMKLNKSTIKEILCEPKPKFKYRQVENQATSSNVSVDSFEPKSKKITSGVPIPAPENQKKKGVHFV